MGVGVLATVRCRVSSPQLDLIRSYLDLASVWCRDWGVADDDIRGFLLTIADTLSASGDRSVSWPVSCASGRIALAVHTVPAY